jgi:hypothetical protein
MRCFICIVIVLMSNSFVASEPPTVDGPRWTAQLKQYGWSRPKAESNKAFFEDFTLSKLEALDIRTKVAFTSETQAVVFHTQQVGHDWQTASRQLQAFFINTVDGSLLMKKDWPASTRGSESDLIDSESRLIPLDQGSIAVMADRKITVYDERRQQVKERKLEASHAGDLWSIQSVANGKELFLRHQSSEDKRTTYLWLDSTSLSEVATMPGPMGKSFSVPVTPGENFVLTYSEYLSPGVTSGIIKLNLDGSTATICSEQLCREDHVLAYSSPFLVISGRRGIAAIDLNRGLRWQGQIPPTSNPNQFQFGNVRTSMSGSTFALWITSTRDSSFDGVPICKNPKVFVYDTESGKLLATLLINPKSGDFDFALSPGGSQLMIFDGSAIRLYAVPRHSS